MSEVKAQGKKWCFSNFVLFAVLAAVFAVSTALHFISRSNDYESMRDYSVFLDNFYADYSQEVLNSDFSRTEEAIEYHINTVFEPVYQGISEVADQHYTIKGQYLELLSDHVMNQVDEIMLRGLNLRLEEADGMVQTVYHEEVAAKTRLFMQEKQSDFSSFEKEISTNMLDMVVSDAKSRFTTPQMITARTASIGIAAMAGNYTYKKVARFIAKRAASRSAGTGSFIATGAAAGATVGGPVGATIGAGVGAVAGWFAADAVIIKIDECLNRDAFEAELRAMVDEYRYTLKQAMLKQLNNANSRLAELTPRDLVTSEM